MHRKPPTAQMLPGSTAAPEHDQREKECVAPNAQEQVMGGDSGQIELKGELLQLSRADSMEAPIEWNEGARAAAQGKMMHEVEKNVVSLPRARCQERTAKEGNNQEKLLELARLQLENEKVRAEADRIRAHNAGTIFKLLLGEQASSPDHGTSHSDSESNDGVVRDLLVAEPVTDPFLAETSFSSSSASIMLRCKPTSMFSMFEKKES